MKPIALLLEFISIEPSATYSPMLLDMPPSLDHGLPRISELEAFNESSPTNYVSIICITMSFVLLITPHKFLQSFLHFSLNLMVILPLSSDTNNLNPGNINQLSWLRTGLTDADIHSLIWVCLIRLQISFWTDLTALSPFSFS